MTVAGQMDVKPYVNITKVYSITGLSIGIPVGTVAQTPYTTAPMKVAYANQMVHIPLPNVHAPATADLADVTAGKEGDKVITIQNSGELAAEMAFKSEDPRFVVPTGKVKVAAKGKYDLKVTFHPDAAGPASTTITVTSTDPDSPTQVIKVTANGADPAKAGGQAGGDPEGVDGPDGPNGANGCGCKTAGIPGSTGGLAGLAGLGLVLGAVARRRSRR